jgi:gamma-glutamylcyclotransferase
MNAKAGLGPAGRMDGEMAKMILTYAYGSNLSAKQMRSRCPSARAEDRAVLPNHALAFGGFSRRWQGAVASIVRSRGAQVEGLLYSISKEDLAALDRFEGHPFAYERVVKVVTDEHGRRRRAHVYVQPEEDFEPGAPEAAYLGVIRRAYGRLGFDKKWLALAAGMAQ